MAHAVVQQPVWQKWRGKLAGSAAGLAVGGPIGAILGVAAGHAYDRYRKALDTVEQAYSDIDHLQNPKTSIPTALDAAFTIGVIALGAKLAHTNERLNPNVVENFRRMFGLPEKHVPLIRKMFEQAVFDRVGYRPYAQQLAQMFENSPEKLEQLIAGLIGFAHQDNVINDEVTGYLRQVAGMFGISETRFMQMLLAEGVLPQERTARDAYIMLGVPPAAPEIVVKQAYRDLLREYHPDLLAQKDIGPAELTTANDRMAAINRAYSEIKKQRGWI